MEWEDYINKIQFLEEFNFQQNARKSNIKNL